KGRAVLEESLPLYLQTRRWFGGKTRRIKGTTFNEVVPIPWNSTEACIIEIQIEYTEEDPELYVVPLSFASGERADQIRESSSGAVLAQVTVRQKDGEKSGVLYDGVLDKEFCKWLVEMIARRRHLRGSAGDFFASPTRVMREALTTSIADLDVASTRVEQSNSSIVFGDQLILKLFRRVYRGVNPDLEVGYFLTERVGFPHAPAVAGKIEYRTKRGETAAVGLLQRYVPNQGDAWRHTLDALSQYFDRAVTKHLNDLYDELPAKAFVDRLQSTSIPASAGELIGPFFENAKLLGQRTAELHVALASDQENPD